jgi:hypothetical protein
MKPDVADTTDTLRKKNAGFWMNPALILKNCACYVDTWLTLETDMRKSTWKNTPQAFNKRIKRLLSFSQENA